MNILKNFLFFVFLSFSSFAILQNNESVELLLEKINFLKKEIESLTASIETNNLTISRLEEANQIRYVDLDKRIHLLETKLLFEETEAEESLEQSINPLSGLVEEDIDSGEFGLWSNSMKLLDNSRYSEASENLRLLILSYPDGTYTGDAYFWLGEIYLVQEMFEDSSEILNAFVTKFDDHPRKADGLYKLALAKVNLEELDLAETLLQEVISNYPNSGAALLAEQDLIKLNPQ
ncbi:tetratricopeptide repeat protein [Gammaproteobacteria bacterium]|nr:tetratricopeptide repeat protein [Gammaproteobacteria bacterium]